MKYIILKGEGAKDFIAEEQEDGSYVKIAQLFDGEAGPRITTYANEGRKYISA